MKAKQESNQEHVMDDLSDEMITDDNQFLIQFPWAGNLGQWKWYYKENRVIFNEKKSKQLGYDPKQFGPIGFEFFTSKLHPDDFNKVMDNMRNHLIGETNAYEVEYRIQHKDGHYIWYYDRGTVTKRDSFGKPLLIEGVVFDITESKVVEDRLRELSEKDALTNVYNRRVFYEKMEKYMDMASSNPEDTFSLIMFDIDHFKKVNDTYGHLAGDECLRQLANLLMDDKRLHDQIFRYGGEEFFLLLPHTNLSESILVAKRIHQLIYEMEIPKVGHITVSMGVVEYMANETLDQLITRVDDLMYDAKKAGRNTIKY